MIFPLNSRYTGNLEASGVRDTVLMAKDSRSALIARMKHEGRSSDAYERCAHSATFRLAQAQPSSGVDLLRRDVHDLKIFVGALSFDEQVA